MSKRYDYADIARGLAMLLVIIGHVKYEWVPFCGAVHIPLFFLISGFLYDIDGDTKYSFFEITKKRVKRLIIPYFIYNIILMMKYVLKLVAGRTLSVKALVDAVLGFCYSASILYKDVPSENNFNGFVFGNGPLWFLTAMAVSSVIFYAIIYFVMKNKYSLKVTFASSISLIIVALLLVYFLPVYLPWSFEMALVGCVFMLAGLSARHYKVFDILQENFRLSVWVLVAGMVVFGGLFALNGPSNIAICVYGKSLFVYVIMGILGAIMLVVLALYIKRCEWLNRFITYVGQNTLIILAFHMTFISLLISVLGKINLTALVESPVFFVVETVVSLLACVVLNELLTKVFKVPKKYL